ncbi:MULTISPECIES: hypothetical protein [Chryseobacterium]|uniref:hypothetical protein n=1 Tax=Chryseobacterium TaxID=59732 RepID=UPI0015549A5D|nr:MULTISPECIES: hypothetical protein [unclassified Chryseobacterium]MDC8106606.1 hypothetical protein [Chryseobacterium sp. B21-037]MDQ1806494.1 hypothetical protein [Chryseobacterium sp. CKR4-1]
MEKKKKLSLEKIQMVKINNLSKIVGGGSKNTVIGFENTEEGGCHDPNNTSKPVETIHATA